MLLSSITKGYGNMGQPGRFLAISLACIGSSILSYVLILIGFVSAWETMGNHDQNGGVAMVVAFSIAPIGGLFVGIAASIWTARALRLSKLEKNSQEDASIHEGRKP